MAGNNSIQGQETVTFTDNMSFDGTERGGRMTADGQLWIGSTASRHVRLGSITSPDGSITVTNGAGSIGLSATGAAFAPNANVQISDDFIASINNSAGLGWQETNPGNVTIFNSPGTPDHPGIGSLTTSTASTNMGFYLKQLNSSGSVTGSGPIALGGGVTSFTWNIQLSALSSGGNTYRFSCGLADETTLAANTDSFVNGVYFQYTNSANSGQWTLKSTKASTTTTVNTTNAVSTSFTSLTIIVNADGTSVSYYVDNVLVGTAITTNIPVAVLSPFIVAINTAGTTPAQLNSDLFELVINLSNPRPGPVNPINPGTAGRILFNYTHVSASYSVLGTDAIIGVDTSGGAWTMTLPNVNLTGGQEWTFKDESGNAASNNITISGNGANIDGASTFVMNTNYGSVTIYCDGTKFFII